MILFFKINDWAVTSFYLRCFVSTKKFRFSRRLKFIFCLFHENNPNFLTVLKWQNRISYTLKLDWNMPWIKYFAPINFRPSKFSGGRNFCHPKNFVKVNYDLKKKLVNAMRKLCFSCRDNNYIYNNKIELCYILKYYIVTLLHCRFLFKNNQITMIMLTLPVHFWKFYWNKN